MDVKYHYVRQLVVDRLVDPVYLSTTEMAADILTKPILKDQFSNLSECLLGVQ